MSSETSPNIGTRRDPEEICGMRPSNSTMLSLTKWKNTTSFEQIPQVVMESLNSSDLIVEFIERLHIDVPNNQARNDGISRHEENLRISTSPINGDVDTDNNNNVNLKSDMDIGEYGGITERIDDGNVKPQDIFHFNIDYDMDTDESGEVSDYCLPSADLSSDDGEIGSH